MPLGVGMRPSAELNQKHYDCPEVGDYWHEHFVPYLVVLRRLDNGNLVICDEQMDLVGGTAFDVDKAREITHRELRDKITYSSDNTKFVADVVPKRLLIQAEIWEARHGAVYVPLDKRSAA